MKFSKDKCVIIAEIGGNFLDLETAKRLIDDAKEAGVDAVKLQTYRAETMVDGSAVFSVDVAKGLNQKEYFAKFEISKKLHEQVYEYARKKGLEIFSTPSHYSDVEMLETLGTDVYKIGADDVTNLPMLKKIALLRKPIMLSTGMSTMEEVEDAVNTILSAGNNQIILMQVVSLYPTPDEYCNLEVINTYRKKYPEFIIGYSDHTMDCTACLYAAVMGAQVIEKHFTYDKNADGPDHIHSATKEEMTELVKGIRRFEAMRGNGVKYPQAGEVEVRENSRKSVITTRAIKAGEKFTEDNLDIKRPGTGIKPKFLPEIIGRTAACDLEKDTRIGWPDIV